MFFIDSSSNDKALNYFDKVINEIKIHDKVFENENIVKLKSKF